MKKLIVIIGIFSVMLAYVFAASAQNTIVTAEQVKSILEGTGKHLIIDARSPDEYREAHIPGALNIPPDRLRSEHARLPKDKSTTMIFYCRGVG